MLRFETDRPHIKSVRKSVDVFAILNMVFTFVMLGTALPFVLWALFTDFNIVPCVIATVIISFHAIFMFIFSVVSRLKENQYVSELKRYVNSNIFNIRSIIESGLSKSLTQIPKGVAKEYKRNLILFISVQFYRETNVDYYGKFFVSNVLSSVCAIPSIFILLFPRFFTAIVYSFARIDSDYAFIIGMVGLVVYLVLDFILMAIPSWCTGIGTVNKQVQEWVAMNYNNQYYTFITYFNPVEAAKYERTN